MSLDRPTPSRMPDLKPNHGLSMNKSWPCFGPRGLKIETGGYLRMKPFIAGYADMDDDGVIYSMAASPDSKTSAASV